MTLTNLCLCGISKLYKSVVFLVEHDFDPDHVAIYTWVQYGIVHTDNQKSKYLNNVGW